MINIDTITIEGSCDNYQEFKKYVDELNNTKGKAFNYSYAIQSPSYSEFKIEYIPSQKYKI